jgi:catechol 2,3-dioxygenase-like lactoylglutathione lyase family enzyme
MGVHHIALATRDLEATHRFYTELMGFTLVKTVVGPTDNPGGWARHVFYDTGGGGMIAFWDLHDDKLGDFPTAISTGIGLPAWVNHLAFDATVEDLDACRDRWLAGGLDVVEVDHGFCRSIYTDDPNGTLVEWCADVRALTPEEADQALAAIHDPHPAADERPDVRFHLAADYAASREPAPVAP